MEFPILSLNHIWIPCQIHSGHIRKLAFASESFRLSLHLLGKFKAINAFVKAGIVINLGCQCHLAAGRELLEHDDIQAGSGCVQGSRITGGAPADHHHII